MVHIYLASQYARKEELRGYAKEATAAGLLVTANWLNERWPPHTTLHDVRPATMRKYAEKDKADIERSDVFVLFAEHPHKHPPRGGRHVELGLALGESKRVYVVGAHENIFHYLPIVHVMPTWGAVLADIRKTYRIP